MARIIEFHTTSDKTPDDTDINNLQKDGHEKRESFNVAVQRLIKFIEDFRQSIIQDPHPKE